MKYNVSAIVSSENLSEALNGLHRFTATVHVTHVESADIGATVIKSKSNGGARAAVAKAPGSAPPVKAAKVKRHSRNKPNRHKAKREVRDGSLNAAAKAIIESYGTPAFELKDLMAKAKAQGLTTPTVFRSIKLEMKAGRLAKVKPGIYQRRGSSFAQQLGFGG